MTDIIAALLTVFAIIALGFWLRRTVFTEEESWRLVDRLNYYIMFPALLVTSLVRADLTGYAIGPIAATVLLGLACGVVLVSVLRMVMALPGPQFASMFQGALRWNGFVALATASGFASAQGVTIVAIVVAALVPTVNILSVLVLARTNDAGATPYSSLPKILITNPLILACIAGVALNGQTLVVDSPLGMTVETLGRAALPLGLMGVGAGLDFAALKGRGLIIAVTTIFKLVVMPLLFFIWGTMLGLEGLTLTIIVMCGAVPGATSSYVLARQLGSDAGLMAGLVTASTLCALVTMPLMLWLLAP